LSVFTGLFHYQQFRELAVCYHFATQFP